MIVGFSFSNSFFTPFVSLLAFLSFHSVIPVVVLLGLYLLGLFWTYYMLPFFYLIIVAQYHHWACIPFLTSFLGPFLPSWASSAHSNSTSPWAFANSFDLSRPNYHILYFWGSWAFHQPLTHLIYYFGPFWPILACFLFHIMPMSLLLLFSGLL